MTDKNPNYTESESEPQPLSIPDGGMTTNSEDTVEIERSLTEERSDVVDGGMSAGFEFDEDLSNMVGDAVTEPVVPPAEAMRGAPMFSEAAFWEPSPTAGSPESESPKQASEQPADQELVSFFVTTERLERLWSRADLAKQAVDSRVQSTSLARMLFDQLKSARNELMGGKDHFEEAERYVNEVEFLIDQDQRMRRWSYSYGTGIFIYELIWAVGIAAALFLLEQQNAFSANASDFIYLLGSVVWGCLGGVLGALFSLNKHISTDQDFERQHSMWYILSPMMGLGIGAVIFIIMRVGLLSLTMGGSQQIASPMVIYILSWLGGYQHNVFTDIVKRVLKAFENESSPPKETTTKPPEVES